MIAHSQEVSGARGWLIIFVSGFAQVRRHLFLQSWEQASTLLI